MGSSVCAYMAVVWPDALIRYVVSSSHSAVAAAAPPMSSKTMVESAYTGFVTILNDFLLGMEVGHQSWFCDLTIQSFEERAGNCECHVGVISERLV